MECYWNIFFPKFFVFCELIEPFFCWRTTATTLRGLVSLRMLLQNIGINLLADQCCIGNVYNAFDGEKLRDKKNQQAIESLAEKLVAIITNLKALKLL